MTAKWSEKGSKLLNGMSINAAQASLEKFEREAIHLATGVMEDTPLGPENPGALRGNWQISKTLNDRVLTTPNKNKGRSFADKKIRGAFTSGRMNKNITLFIFNNSPYAGVVEFGGYPEPVKQGTWIKKKQAYEIRSIAGFSRQAPIGMIRTNILNYKNRMRNK